MISLYLNEKKDDEAINSLTNCLNNNLRKNNKDSFENFIYYFELLKVYTLNRNMENSYKIISQIKNIIPNDKNIKEYAAWEFGQFAYELFKQKKFDLSEKISYESLELDNTPHVKKLYEASKKLNEAYTLCIVLFEDKKVLKEVKKAVYYGLYSYMFDTDELNKKRKYNVYVLQKMAKNHLLL